MVGDSGIRTASSIDAEELAAHVNAGYRGDSSRMGWTTEADLIDGTRTTADQLRAEMALPNVRFEILRDEAGAIVGSVELVRESKLDSEGVRGFAASGEVEGVGLRAPSRPECYLGMLTVRPTLQGAGLGKRMLEHSERVAREWGCSRIRMTVIDRRVELIAYYERRGYIRTGVKLPFHFDDPRFGIAKVPLQMVELAKEI
jgi:GNAT superfamily N-acetyltransferase